MKVLQRKGGKNHPVVWALLSQSCSLLFIFVHMRIKTDLIEKVRSTKINYCNFMVSLSILKQLYFIIFICLLLILWILNFCSIFVTICTFAQFWGTFNEEKYWFIRSKLPVFSAMNLLKQVTLLVFWKYLEWTRFSRTNFFNVAQRTREDVKYFKGELYSFFCNYLEYHLVSW